MRFAADLPLLGYQIARAVGPQSQKRPWLAFLPERGSLQCGNALHIETDQQACTTAESISEAAAEIGRWKGSCARSVYVSRDLLNRLEVPARDDMISAKQHKEITAAVQLPETRQRLTNQGLDPTTNTPEEFAQVLRREIPRLAKVIRAAGIQQG